MPFKFLGRWGKVKNSQRTVCRYAILSHALAAPTAHALRHGNTSCLRTIQLQTAGRPNRPAAPYFSVPIRTRQLNQQASVLQQTIANMLIELEQERGGSRGCCSGTSERSCPETQNGSPWRCRASCHHGTRGPSLMTGR